MFSDEQSLMQRVRRSFRTVFLCGSNVGNIDENAAPQDTDDELEGSCISLQQITGPSNEGLQSISFRKFRAENRCPSAVEFRVENGKLSAICTLHNQPSRCSRCVWASIFNWVDSKWKVNNFISEHFYFLNNSYLPIFYFQNQFILSLIAWVTKTKFLIIFLL